MKIISLQAENIKRLVAVNIAPDGNLVQITGKNGQGKTSVLDAIWWAIAGTSHIQAAPIRKGATEGVIRLDLGEIKVTRKFRAQDGGDYTTSIVVENAEGARYPSPQTMLDKLLGALTFDPLAFARSDPREQFQALQRFVPDFDFEKAAAARSETFQIRTATNRQIKEKQATIEQTPIPEGYNPKLVDESVLIDQLESAHAVNGDIEVRKANREKAKGDIKRMRETAQSYQGALDNHRQHIADLQKQAVEKEKEIVATLKKAKDLQDKLDAAPPLPEAQDTAGIRAALEKAKVDNRKAQEATSLLGRRQALSEELVALEAKASDLTLRIDKLDALRDKAVSSAKMPVPGLTFGDGTVLFNGVPFEQSSDAEQLRVSVAIAMAANPQLRVIRVRDGSLLDEDSMKLLGRMADEQDMQVWVESVDSSGTVGFVLEDGHARKAEAEPVETPKKKKKVEAA